MDRAMCLMPAAAAAAAQPHMDASPELRALAVTRLLVSLALDARARGPGALARTTKASSSMAISASLHAWRCGFTASSGASLRMPVDSPGEDAADIDGRPSREGWLGPRLRSDRRDRGPVVQGPHGLLELLHLRARVSSSKVSYMASSRSIAPEQLKNLFSSS